MALARLASLALLASLSSCGAKTGLASLRFDAPAEIPDAGVDAPFVPPPPTPQADKIDLLFVIDGSGSMGDKQQILALAIPDVVRRLTNPLCVDTSGVPVSPQPSGSTSECPEGSGREFNSVQDMHIGVVSSNMGTHGAPSGCGPLGVIETDRGRLVSRGVRSTYDSKGFLAWDPARTKKPAGENDPAKLEENVRDLVLGVDEIGCAAEAPLEAMYHFLIDPEPYRSVELEACSADSTDICAVLQGTDEILLRQRSDFLRPDSLVAIVLLSDENDCSVVDGGDNWRVLGADPLARGTSPCRVNPSDPCCRPCDAPTPNGCVLPVLDAECNRPAADPSQDSPYLRCWDQKRRFGRDFLYPLSRYIDGLVGNQVPRRDGSLVDNPLYVSPAGLRHPSLVFFAALVGVPWQDLAVDPRDAERLVYKTAAEMHADGTWDIVLGQPEQGVAPSDPLMVESVEERSGVNPVTGDPVMPSTAQSPRANPMNGHEMVLTMGGIDMQYACIFELPEARDCGSSFYCECGQTGATQRKPICQADDGEYQSVQRFAKAYPGLRQLGVLRGIGENAIAASICARNVTDPARQDYGYRPALTAVIDRLRDGLF